MKRIALITGSVETAKALSAQLLSFLSDDMQLESYVSDDGIKNLIDTDVLVFSSEALYLELKDSGLFSEHVPKVIGNRSINFDALDVLVSIPAGKRVLFVNDLYETAKEAYQALCELGVNQFEAVLYYPGCQTEITGIECAITPGEMKYVPAQMSEVIDIGPRIFDFKTIARILTELEIFEKSSVSFSKMYLEKIVKVARNLAESKALVTLLNENLQNVIESLETGLLIFDAGYKIVLLNDTLKELLKVKRYQYLGNTLNRVIVHKKLLLFLMNSSENHFVFSADGIEYTVTKFRLSDNQLVCASFKSDGKARVKEADKAESIRKGYVAKYTLDDIVGVSHSIRHTRHIIGKLAKTEMNILIQGESGTGKELVASAIHNHSNREGAPFLAVNFSALPDELIESELFGYAEGAFTGAKRGGKVGLFEEANGGTIFLDEIGDISLKVQSRLLRVLEEREIMQVGGNEIRPIDVRVIAATNKDLVQMIREKKFREDLYFRLKMGIIPLSPLRERKEDIKILLKHMASTLSFSDIVFESDLISQMERYEWLGNIRELKNTLSYMLAVRQSDTLTLRDLPTEAFHASIERNTVSPSETTILNGEQLHFLKMISDLVDEDLPISRQQLAIMSLETKYKRTENQVRRILNQLKDFEMIRVGKGRKGIELLPKGKQLVK